MKSITIHRKQSGDTIVEVLVSIAVVSLVLAGAYALTNRNTLITQDTQEHGQALQLVQAQVEYLRANNGFNTNQYNCFDSSGNPAQAAANGHPCLVGNDGMPVPTGVQPAFDLSITLGQNGCSAASYSVQAQWDSILSNGKNNVTVCYLL